MRMLWRIVAKADHIAAIPRIIAKHIQNLTFSELASVILLAFVRNPIRVYEGQKRLIRCVTQYAPLVQIG
ncbi:hypothetical protein D1872_329570 [compost metagenome]